MPNLSNQIIEMTKELGPCLAGIASIEELKESPSHLIYGRLNDGYDTIGNKPAGKIRPGEIAWPENAGSAIVIAVEHPQENPDLDWWRDGYPGGTPGNRILISISSKLTAWLGDEKGIRSRQFAYHIEDGGIFLKDAAVLAGLGCIGKSNMLVTRRFGPRVRLRAIFIEEVLPPTGPVDFDPCVDCTMPCRKACPRLALEARIYGKEEFGVDRLPARNGVYDRSLCNAEMQADREKYDEIRIEGKAEPGRLVRFCRSCEFSCPVGETE